MTSSSVLKGVTAACMYSSIACSACVVLAHLLALMFTRYTLLLPLVVQLCGDHSTSFIASHVLYPDVGDVIAIVVSVRTKYHTLCVGSTVVMHLRALPLLSALWPLEKWFESVLYHENIP